MKVADLQSTQAAAAPKPAAANTRAVDGDYKVRNASTSQVKDADGDYKAVPASAAGTSSNAVQAALSSLKKGG